MTVMSDPESWLSETLAEGTLARTPARVPVTVVVTSICWSKGQVMVGSQMSVSHRSPE